MAADTLDWVHTNVCLSPALTTDSQKRLRMQPFAVPRIPTGCDVIARSGADGRVYPIIDQSGSKLMIDQQMSWYNDTPLDHHVRIIVTRGWRSWVTSNPNSIELVDRWESAVDGLPPMPVPTDNVSSRAGSAIDLATDTVSVPKPGRHWEWTDAASQDEWVGPLEPGETLNLWYQAYFWTPPPWADNANRDAPEHSVRANYTRIQLMVFPVYDLTEGYA